MSNTKKTEKISNVPRQLFEQFLKELEKQKVPEEVVKRLVDTLVNNGQISVKALKAALFEDNNIST